MIDCIKKNNIKLIIVVYLRLQVKNVSHDS